MWMTKNIVLILWECKITPPLLCETFWHYHGKLNIYTLHDSTNFPLGKYLGNLLHICSPCMSMILYLSPVISRQWQFILLIDQAKKLNIPSLNSLSYPISPYPIDQEIQVALISKYTQGGKKKKNSESDQFSTLKSWPSSSSSSSSLSWITLAAS